MDWKYWPRMLGVNAAAAVAVVGISGGFSPHVSWAAFGRSLGIALVYANCIGTLLGVVMPRVAAGCWPNRSPATTWTMLVVTMVAGTTVGTIAATSLLLAIGVVPRRLFVTWLESALGTALFISVIICLAITTYEILRSRLEQATLALRTKERHETEARRLAAEAQLAALESRVQPHFLFNTLNSIAALTHDDPTRAERMTTQLASLLRASLDSQNSPLVPLADELQNVHNYLEIERVRFGDRLRYAFEADDTLREVRVPRLAVQTLVENSVKYAVSPRREGGTILVRAAAANGHLRVEVADDGPGFDASALPEGHGLALLRARLRMLFADRASLQIASEPASTRVAIDLPV